MASRKLSSGMSTHRARFFSMTARAESLLASSSATTKARFTVLPLPISTATAIRTLLPRVPTRRAWCSSAGLRNLQTEPDLQCPVHEGHLLGGKAPDARPDSLPPCRSDLIDHDLRFLLQTICRSGMHGQANGRRILQVRS